MITDRMNFGDRLADFAKLGHDSCWVWPGAINDGGYGLVSYEGKVRRAHRLAYELIAGPIPDGLTLDHLCRTRPCINPAHLEPVTQQINNHRGNCASGRNARRTACVHGHALSGANLRVRVINGRPHRQCRACARRATAAYRAQLRKEAA